MKSWWKKLNLSLISRTRDAKVAKLKFVYATDLHGNEKKYEDVLYFSKEMKVNIIHIGADVLPKGSSMQKTQKKFINGFLKELYTKVVSEEGKSLYLHFGNDDLYTRKKYFKNYGTLLDEQPEVYDKYIFRAYSYVPDYPFGLKTACKLDSPNWKLSEPYISIPVEIGDQGFYPIPDVDEYFKHKGTISEDLKALKMLDPRRTIFSIHTPPANVDLDVCMGYRRVGSQAVYKWIEENQPLLVLCGHIHESPDVTSTWKAKIGDTTVIQPGQPQTRTSVVYIEVDNKKVHSEIYRI